MIKILVTIGPASESKPVLLDLSKKTNLFRLNGSHNNLDWHKKTVQKIREVCPKAFILMDIPGSKPRTSNTASVKIESGQEVVFGNALPNEKRLCVALTKQLPSTEGRVEQFSINDGQYLFDVIHSGDGHIIGRSRSSFELLPKKGINIPSGVYDETKQLEIYEDFINKLDGLEVDALGLSFVQTGGLVKAVREVASDMVLVSKLENSEGLRNCQEIISESDAIMIDRGDLAAEIGLTHLYDAVEAISRATKSSGKPLIMATENLESMIDRQVPSKSEVISLAHSAYIGSDCIMLSEETATTKSGPYIASWLSQFLNRPGGLTRRDVIPTRGQGFPEIWDFLPQIGEMPLIIMTKSGYALFEYIATKPNGNVVLLTNNKKIIKIAQLLSNNLEVIVTDVSSNTPIETIWGVIKENKDKFFAKDDRIAAIYVSKYVRSARANCLTIFHREDF
jgi:pyruvate kinase